MKRTTMNDKFNPVNSVIDDAVEAAERAKNREVEQLRAALMGAVEALENCDRHVGLFGGERAKLEKAREALKSPTPERRGAGGTDRND